MPRTLTPNDYEIVDKTVQRAYELVQDVPLPRLLVDANRSPEIVGLSKVCIELSDATTRAAQSLGVAASRECHVNHAFTSPAPLDQLPSENDLILCLTWGQFNARSFLENPKAYFGVHREIASKVSGHYDAAYGENSIVFRQITHSPPLNYPIPVH